MRTTLARSVAFGVVLLCSAVAAVPAAASDTASPLVVRSSSADVRDLAPGDWVEWTAETTSSSDETLPLRVIVEADGTDALAADPENGLQLVIDFCDGGFTAIGSPARYDCSSADVALGAGAAATIGRLESLRSIGAGATAGVRIRIVFPVDAGNEFENTAAGLRVTFAVPDGSVSATPDGPLAITGADIGAALLGALGALLLGSLALSVARRRREEPR
ncbi:LPXTG cell wall anchor domain-containing protein [Microbacteriaceae bacterium VKM Ac-2855]|nr:LPXTG cell wall anchor domain-containing protein [Microbacteriaceae bacterium VKM Ac-2855]